MGAAHSEKVIGSMIPCDLRLSSSLSTSAFIENGTDLAWQNRGEAFGSMCIVASKPSNVPSPGANTDLYLFRIFDTLECCTL